MNEYLKIFQSIALSIEQILKKDLNSKEIKQSATQLNKSCQPCLEEIKQTATRFKPLVQVCLNDLDCAEDIWHSKPRIAAAAKDEIWEQLGELSGCHFRIQRLGNKGKCETIKQTKDFWEGKTQELRDRWFIDQKTRQPKQGIGWGDKDGFIKDIKSVFESESIIKIMGGKIDEYMNLIEQQTNGINLEKLESSVLLFDDNKKEELNKIVNSTNIGIKMMFSTGAYKFHEKIAKFKFSISAAFNDLVKQRLGDISWEEVAQFKKQVSLNIEYTINSIFDEKVKLATQAVEEAIAFYNDLLERKESYQQETPEQRQAEKDWIDQQRQELNKVLNGLEVILNPFTV